MPEVSVIMPVYNTAPYLGRCLRSLQDQTLKDIEVLAVDDGSTDGSAELLDRWATDDSRFRVFHCPHAGPARRRNFALDRAQGRFVMFCDSDDAYEPEMCERMADVLLREDVDFAQCDASWQAEDDVPQSEAEFRRSEPSVKALPAGRVALTDAVLLTSSVYLWSKIFRRDLIVRHGIRFPDGGFLGDDAAFVHQYGMVSSSVFHLPVPLYRHALRQASIMGEMYREARKVRNDGLAAAMLTLGFAERQGIVQSRLEFIQGMIGMHYRTYRACFDVSERPALLRKFNDLLATLPPPRKRIVDLGGRTLMVGIAGKQGQ